MDYMFDTPAVKYVLFSVEKRIAQFTGIFCFGISCLHCFVKLNNNWAHVVILGLEMKHAKLCVGWCKTSIGDESWLQCHYLWT